MPPIGNRRPLPIHANDLAHFLEGWVRRYDVPEGQAMLGRFRFARLRQLRSHQNLPKDESERIHVSLITEEKKPVHETERPRSRGFIDRTTHIHV